ncbi:MAG: DNA methyltransferase, partial [Chthoniobacteraceae bacterium]
KAAAVTLDRQGKTKDAAAEVQRFHRRLCEVRVLDPACGSGNFLYVTLEHLKRLEGEVLNALDRLGHEQAMLEMAGFSVLPRQLLGIEVNPRAAAIAELVLWIGYIQWHFRTRGRTAPIEEPIIKNFHNIECRDAVLASDRTKPVLDEQGAPVTRWDGRTMKKHPVTGEDVPDETARVPLLSYVNPRPAEWPEADFIVGNPPFIGTARMRDALGDGYTEAVRKVHAEVGESSDFVMYWWNMAAHRVRDGRVKRFGFITTNSLRQTFNRRVIEPHLAAKEPLSLVFAIPDHPWVDSADGADVRIAMTAAIAGHHEGELRRVTRETPRADGEIEVVLAEQRGLIHADLTVGANVAAAGSLQANANLSNRGMMLFGAGFIVTPDEAKQLGWGLVHGIEKHIRRYRNGRDITATPREAMVIDLYGLTPEEVRAAFPEIYQWVFDRVKPERDQNRDAQIRSNWWLHGRPRPELRAAANGLRRYIATVETMKHRLFVFLDASILPDNKLIVFAFDDAFFLGVLSSRIHVVWALASGSHLGVGNDPVYVKSASFETFPFPTATEAQQTRIRDLAERLDAHRKRQQAQHPKLTLTDCYNVLEKLRAGTPLNAKEQL